MKIWFSVDHPYLQDMIYGIGGIINFGFELTGRGTNEEVYKIVRLHKPYEGGITLQVEDCIDYLEINGFNLSRIHLKKCENVSILNVKLRKLELKDCSSIEVKNANVRKKISIIKCKKVNLQELTVKKYQVELSEEISRVNCVIKKFT